LLNNINAKPKRLKKGVSKHEKPAKKAGETHHRIQKHQQNTLKPKPKTKLRKKLKPHESILKIFHKKPCKKQQKF